MKLIMENIPEPLQAKGVGLTECLKAFGRACPVERVVLFGSYARGEQGPDSDVDLCVVAEGAERQLETARTLRRAIRDVRPKPPMTLIPITPARLREKQQERDYFFETIMKEGVCVATKD